MSLFIPSAADFEKQHDYPAHYPPFPSRFYAQTPIYAQVPKTSVETSHVRRVRPVPIAPPPGFESFAAARDASHRGEDIQLLANMRALAGALAGDWSSNRQLPEIPSFLLADLAVQSGMDANNCTSLEAVLALFSNHSLSACHQPQQQPNLANFCRDNQIRSNIFQSQSVKDVSQEHLLAARMTGMPSSASTTKRRLVPTMITTDNILSPSSNVWASPKSQQSAPASAFGQDNENPQTPVKNKSVQLPVTSFQRTPRAPKIPSKNVIAKSESTLAAVLKKQEQKASDFSLFQVSTAQSPITQPASDNNSPVPLSTGPTTVSCTPCTDSEPAREKIPPAPEAPLEHKIMQRQKQVNIGKNTPEYFNFRRLVPRKERKQTDPMTPDKYQLISKRNWEGQMKAWRRRMHEFEPPARDADNVEEPRKYTAIRDPRLDDISPNMQLEDGELLFWKEEDEAAMEPYGGLKEWEKFMLDHVRSVKEAEENSEACLVVQGFRPVNMDDESSSASVVQSSDEVSVIGN